MSIPAYPTKLYIGITDKCNARCVMCWRNFYPLEFKDMDEKILKKISNAFSVAEEIGWWGDGEIFCCDYLDKIFAYMKECPDVKHKFATNGQLLAKYAEELSCCNISEMLISIDGVTEATFSSIRRGCSLAKISEGIAEYYKQCGKSGKEPASIMFSFTAMKSNIEELPLLVDFAYQNKVHSIHVQSLKFVDEKVKSMAISLDVEKEYFIKAKDRAVKLGIYIKHEVFGDG